MVDAVDLPETTALPAVPRRFRVMLRLAGNDPFCDAGIYACGLAGALNVGRTPNRRPVAEVARNRAAEAAIEFPVILSSAAYPKEVQIMANTYTAQRMVRKQ
jgi:hypothetical protein